MRRRLLLVEDDPTLRQALTFNLAREGYEVATAADGEAALEAARNERLDLVLLDVMLPGMSGVEVLRVLRREGVTTPVIILSAKGDEIDRVVGLKVGADDYVAKPFSRPELLARIEAVLRRHRREADEPERREQLSFDRVAIDVARREVRVDDEPIHLTTKEFDLLAHMASVAGSDLHPRPAAGADLGLRLRRATVAPSTSTSAGCAASCAGLTATTTSAPCAAWATPSRHGRRERPDRRRRLRVPPLAPRRGPADPRR